MVNSINSYNNFNNFADSYGGFTRYTNSPYQQHAAYYGNYYDVQKENNEDKAAKTLGLAALLQGIALLLQKGSRWCSYKLQQGKEFATEADIKKVASHMVKKNKLDVTVGYVSEANKPLFEALYGQGHFDAVAKGENAFFSSGQKLAVAPKCKPSLILHELGHAITSTKGKVLKFMQNSRRYAMSAPTALLFLSALMPKKEDGKGNFIQRNAGLLGFAAFAPTIIEEGLASWRGVKAAKEVLGKTAKLAPLKRNYAFALATYVLAGIGLGVAAKQTIISES